MSKITRDGYGQVEPNHLSAQRTGQIYAQLPCDDSIEVLENGMFVKYDYAAGKVSLTGNGESMLVYNEVKLYDEPYRETYKDFAMIKDNYVDGEMVPRVFKTNIGDIYTTNMIDSEADVEVGTKLYVQDDGILGTTESDGLIWQVAKIYTMPDGQPAVKIQRIG